MKAYVLIMSLYLISAFKIAAQPSPPYVYFSQDFCDPGVPFQSESPDSRQVDFIITSSSAHVARGDCYLDAARIEGTAGGSVRILRTTPLLAGIPAQTLHFRTTLDVRDITQPGNIAAYFGIGDQLPVNTTLISNAVLFSKLSIDFNSDGSYNFRVTGAGSPILSGGFTGPVTITWVLNNSVEDMVYLNPENGTSLLGPGKYDVWLDQDRWLAGVNRLSDVPLNNFAFILSNGVGSVRLFGLEVSNNGFHLPLVLARFKAERKLQAAQLNWEMAPGHTAAYFSIERSSDGLGFEAIGGVPVPEEDTEKARFDFTDPQPKTGWNYYRLKMIGYDGEVGYSPVETVYFDPLEPAITLAPNPSDPGKITLLASGVSPEQLTLMSMAGTKLPFDYQYDQSAMRLDIYPSRMLPTGIYLLQLRQGRTLKTVKVVIP